MSRIDVFYMQGKSCFLLLHVDKYCGHMVKVRCFRAFICDNMSCAYAYLCLRRCTDICVHVYIHTHIYVYMCGKANCVAFIAICTLFRAYGQSLTFS